MSWPKTVNDPTKSYAVMQGEDTVGVYDARFMDELEDEIKEDLKKDRIFVLMDRKVACDKHLEYVHKVNPELKKS